MALNPTDIGVMFDCDGTLLDSMPAWRGMETHLAELCGVELSKAQRDDLTTFSIPECAKFFHDMGLGADEDEVLEIMDGYMYRFYSELSVPRPGALELVRGLYEAGAHLAITSSTPQHYLQAGMKHCGFAPYLEVICSVDDVNSSKRTPKVWQYAQGILGTATENTWGVEDALYAVLVLKEAGYHTLGIHDHDLAGSFAQLYAECDHAVHTFEGFSAGDFLAIACSEA